MSPIRPCLSSLSYFKPIVKYCILKYRLKMSLLRRCLTSRRHLDLQTYSMVLYKKDRSNMSPIRPGLPSNSYFRPLVWYFRYKNSSNMSPIPSCLLSLSCFRLTVWYCSLKDRSKMSPIRPCLLSLSYFRPIVWYCTKNDRSIMSPK